MPDLSKAEPGSGMCECGKTREAETHSCPWSYDRAKQDARNWRSLAARLAGVVKESIRFCPYQGESEETVFLREARAALAAYEAAKGDGA